MINSGTGGEQRACNRRTQQQVQVDEIAESKVGLEEGGGRRGVLPIPARDPFPCNFLMVLWKGSDSQVRKFVHYHR